MIFLNSNFYFKPIVKYIVLIIITALLSIGLFLGITSYHPEANDDVKPIYSYNILQNNSYNVELYDNSFIKDTTMSMDESYLSDLIKNIHFNFNFDLNGSKKTDLEIFYGAKAYIIGTYRLMDDNTDSKVWKKEYELIPETSINSEISSNYSVRNELDLNYAFYNEQALSFKDELDINIDPTLEVHYYVKVNGYEGGRKINNIEEALFKMPLNDKAFKITKTFDAKKNYQIINSSEKESEFNKPRAIIAVLLILTGIIIFIYFFDAIFRIPKKTAYSVLLKKYMKEYDDIIIEIVTPVSEEEMNIIYVKSFDEMIGLEDELRVPIMFYEIVPNYQGIFYLVHENILYEYMFDNENLEKEKL